MANRFSLMRQVFDAMQNNTSIVLVDNQATRKSLGSDYFEKVKNTIFTIDRVGNLNFDLFNTETGQVIHEFTLEMIEKFQ